MADVDAVFVGAGINGLVGAAMLAREGWEVCVLERNSWLGGAIRSAEITRPGFTHDLYSAWHPLFVGGAAYEELGEDLHARGLEYLNTDHPVATAFPDGSSLVLGTDTAANAEEFERVGAGDGRAWEAMVADFGEQAEVLFGILGTELWSSRGVRLGMQAVREFEPRGTLRLAGEMLATARDWLTSEFASPEVRGLLAPLLLHAGLGPDDAGSAIQGKIIAAAFEMGGMPIPAGGADQLVEALRRLIEDHGGRLRTDTHVEEVVVRAGRALGVRTAAGDRIRARRAVICSVTPTQLYLDLLEGHHVPGEVRREADRFRYGRADMQMHLALSEPPAWRGDAERLRSTAMVHVTPGLDGVSRAVNEAERGLLPAEPTIVVGQPMAVDPSRGPDGSWILWIQLQELPSKVTGDAAGEIDVGDGSWTDSLRERYADRIVDRMSMAMPGLEDLILDRVCLSPADLHEANVNLVGGDPYAGSCKLDQYFLWRPLRGFPGHETPVDRLYHIGASTHPGPGLHGASGWIVADQLRQAGPLSRLGGLLRP